LAKNSNDYLFGSFLVSDPDEYIGFVSVYVKMSHNMPPKRALKLLGKSRRSLHRFKSIYTLYKTDEKKYEAVSSEVIAMCYPGIF
jgi:hypothetical protein